MSTASTIALAITDRIQQITTANGYQTNIGGRAYRGKLRLDESQMPCVVIIELPGESSSAQTAACKTTAGYLIEGHSDCDPENPNDVGHLIIADLKKAIFSGDLTFYKKAIACRYVGCTIEPRTDGLSLVSANIEIAIDYVENLASP